MQERERSVFSVDGAGGFFVAVLLLLSILAFLVYNAGVVQAANASNYYDIKDEKSIKMISVDNAKHIVDAK
jgi:hypothetical protein